MHNAKIGTSTFLYHQSHFDDRPDLRAFLESSQADELAEKYPNTLIVLGGDGTLLRAIREYSRQDEPLLGVNFGSKGNLMIQREHLDAPMQLQDFPLLHGHLESLDSHIDFFAFNEIVCKSTSGRSIRLQYKTQDVQGEVSGDGLLVSTPGGSTGYNLAAGGPIVPSGSGKFILTPLIPFDPIDMKSIVFDDDRECTISVINDRARAVSVYADGEAVIEHSRDPIRLVIKKSKHSVSLYQPKG